MKDIFTSLWFWFMLIAYCGANWGGYAASKQGRGIVGLFATIVKIALYVLVILLFWRLDAWYYPLIVFACMWAFDSLSIHFLMPVMNAETVVILGHWGTWYGITLGVGAYLSLFNALPSWTMWLLILLPIVAVPISLVVDRKVHGA